LVTVLYEVPGGMKKHTFSLEVHLVLLSQRLNIQPGKEGGLG
jgi:hypothetical protein